MEWCCGNYWRVRLRTGMSTGQPSFTELEPTLSSCRFHHPCLTGSYFLCGCAATRNRATDRPSPPSFSTCPSHRQTSSLRTQNRMLLSSKSGRGRFVPSSIKLFRHPSTIQIQRIQVTDPIRSNRGAAMTLHRTTTIISTTWITTEGVSRRMELRMSSGE